MSSSKIVQVAVENAFSSGNFIVSGNQLLIVNPTNQVVVYRVVPESTGAVSVSISDSLVAVPAGSSKTVLVDATSNVAGTQTFAVNIFSADGSLLERVEFATSGNGKDSGAASSIVVLTVILAIIFIVLLIVLIVLIGKKPEKEEFGESYY
jgi:cobalamin biosynthesis Mg chelatase CobN